MGWFGSKQPQVDVKISDLFTADDLRTIEATIAPKQAAGAYGLHGFMAKALLDAVRDPETPLDARTLSHIENLLNVAGGIEKLESSLKPMFDAAFERLDAIRRGEV